MEEMPEHEIDWNAGAELTGCSALQVRFVQGLCQGLSKTRAAKAAGTRWKARRFAGRLRGSPSRTR